MKKSERSQWSSTYAVALELTRRNYRVGWPMGNSPEKDLLVEAPSGTSFVVDVKGGEYSLNRKGTSSYQHLFQRHILEKVIPNLYVIFVRVPPEEDKSLEFFILSNKDCQELYRKQSGEYIPDNCNPCLTYDALKPYLCKWNNLPK